MPTLLPWICLVCLRRLQIPRTLESLLFIFKCLGTRHVLNKHLFIAYRIGALFCHSLSTAGQPHCHPIRVRTFSVCLFFLSFFLLSFALCLGSSCTLLCLHPLACFMKRCFVRFTPSFASPSPASLWFSRRKPFVLNRQTLICISPSALRQGCQATSPAPALEQLCEWSRAAGRDCVCSSLVRWALGPAHLRGQSQLKCLPCRLGVPKTAAC